jgi:hypothetical protein
MNSCVSGKMRNMRFFLGLSSDDMSVGLNGLEERQSLELVILAPYSELCGFRPGAWSGVAWIAGLWGAAPRHRGGGLPAAQASAQGQAGLVPRIGPETSHAPWFRQQAIM